MPNKLRQYHVSDVDDDPARLQELLNQIAADGGRVVSVVHRPHRIVDAAAGFVISPKFVVVWEADTYARNRA